MNDAEIFFGKKADPTWEELFCSLYEVERPSLRFLEIMHWSGMVRAWGLETLAINEQRVLVASGFFYGVHSAAPDEQTIALAEERARDLGCDWVLFPLVRAGDGAVFQGAGYERLPWFVESEYRIVDSVDRDLEAQIGRNTAKNIRRLVRKAEADYMLDFHFIEGLEPGRRREVVDVFSALHWENLRKYGHRKNTHGADQIDILLRSPLADTLLVCVRREPASTVCVQASLNLVSRPDKTLSMVVSGMCRERIPPQHNLYQAETYQLYRWGEDNGIEVFNLGRGAAEAKSMLGCNRFYVLEHHLKPVSNRAARSDLAPIRERAAQSIDTQLAAVAARRTRGGFEVTR